MILSKLNIQNFQRWERIDLELGPVTALTGPSNSGKSAIVRALNVLLTNPRGRDYIKHGAKFVEISLEGNGHTAAFFKSRSAHYVIDGTRYDNLGPEVPQLVGQIFKLGHVELSDTLVENVNIRNQFDGTFFVSATAPARAKLLSLISGSDTINRAVATANQRRRTHSENIRSLQNTIGLNMTMASKVTVLRDVDAQFAQVEWGELALRERTIKIDRLRLLGNKLTAANTEHGRTSRKIDEYSKYIGLPAFIDKIESEANRLASLRVRADRLKLLVFEYKDWEARGRYYRDALEKPLPELGPMDSLVAEIEQREMHYSKMVDMAARLKKQMIGLGSAQGLIVDIEQRVMVTQYELSVELGGMTICPVCERPM